MQLFNDLIRTVSRTFHPENRFRAHRPNTILSICAVPFEGGRPERPFASSCSRQLTLQNFSLVVITAVNSSAAAKNRYLSGIRFVGDWAFTRPAIAFATENERLVQEVLTTSNHDGP